MTITPEIGQWIAAIVMGAIVLAPIVSLILCDSVQDKKQPLGKYTAFEVEEASGDWFRVDM